MDVLHMVQKFSRDILEIALGNIAVVIYLRDHIPKRRMRKEDNHQTGATLSASHP